MATPTTDLLEIILRECAGARPQPWYPSDYARATGVARDSLDGPLDQLRLGGLVRLTDWVQGKGQGYALTPAGERVLERPRLLERLRAGVVPRAGEGPPPGNVQPEERAPGWERARAVRNALLTQSPPVVTLGLIAVNVLVFLVGAARAQQRGVLGAYVNPSLGLTGPRQVDAAQAGQERLADEIRHSTGELDRADVVVEGEWWRLLSSCFVHIGFLHILMNMYALYVLGPLLERMWGPTRYLLLYLIAGFVSSCVVMIYSPATGRLAGASGAICGVLGAMAAWVYLNRSYLPRDFSAGLTRAIVTNVILIVFISLLPGVSAAGHFGGGVGGLVAAVPMNFSRFGTGAARRGLGLLGALLVPVIAFAWMNHSLADTRARTVLQKTEQIGTAVLKEDIGPLCSKVQRGQKVTPDEVKAALARAERAREQVQELAGKLPSPALQYDGSVRSALEAGQEYVAAWLRLLDEFQRAFANGRVPSAEEACAVRDLMEPVNRYAKQLRESVLFSGPEPHKQAEP